MKFGLGFIDLDSEPKSEVPFLIKGTQKVSSHLAALECFNIVRPNTHSIHFDSQQMRKREEPTQQFWKPKERTKTKENQLKTNVFSAVEKAWRQNGGE